MKKLVLLFLIILGISISAQPEFKHGYRLGIKSGLALTTVSGGRAKSAPKAGLVFGLWLQLKMNKSWTTKTEVLFVEKGTGRRIGYHVGLYYFEIPVLIQYHKKEFSFEFGPGFGILAAEAEFFNSGGDLTDTYPFATRELSFNSGFVYSVNGRWDLGFRATSSVVPVRKQVPQVSRDVYNIVFAFTLAHQLRVKKPKVKEVEE